jgi:hypothetical protein
VALWRVALPSVVASDIAGAVDAQHRQPDNLRRNSNMTPKMLPAKRSEEGIKAALSMLASEAAEQLRAQMNH